LTLAPISRAQSPIAGDWLGTVTNAAGAQFRIGWHVTSAPDGTLSATIDNIDQGVYAVPIKSMTVAGSHVTQTLDTVVQMNGQSVSVRGSFDGTIDKDAKEIKGTWTQTEPEQAPAEVDMKRAPAAAALTPAPQPVQATQPVGDWQGILSVEGNQLHISLHITAAADGPLSATADDPDQGQMGARASAISFKDSKLTIAFDVFNGIYQGTLSTDGNQINGIWTQEQPVDLNFTRVPAQAVPAPKPAGPA
jgi:hypothetical protein